MTFMDNGLHERQRLAGDAITLQRAAGVLKRRCKNGWGIRLLIHALEYLADKMRDAAEGGKPWPTPPKSG